MERKCINCKWYEGQDFRIGECNAPSPASAVKGTVSPYFGKHCHFFRDKDLPDNQAVVGKNDSPNHIAMFVEAGKLIRERLHEQTNGDEVFLEVLATYSIRGSFRVMGVERQFYIRPDMACEHSAEGMANSVIDEIMADIKEALKS